MYVEDLLLAIKTRMNSGWTADGRLNDQWYQNFIHSIAEHITARKSLSTNQSRTILRLIARVRHQIMHIGMATDDELDEMLSRPQFRQPLYESVNIPREVRHLGDNLLGFRFKQNEEIVDRIKALGQSAQSAIAVVNEVFGKPRFDWDYRVWIVPVIRHNLAAITLLINEYRFNLNVGTADYLRLAKQSRDQPSTVHIAHEVIMANVCDNAVLAGWVTEVADGVVL